LITTLFYRLDDDAEGIGRVRRSIDASGSLPFVQRELCLLVRLSKENLIDFITEQYNSSLQIIMLAGACIVWTTALMMMNTHTDTNTALDKVTVTDLYRYAVKGLGADAVEQVTICQQGETFPDDRRFALMKTSKMEEFWAPPVHSQGASTSTSQEWVHKENFLCAFTAPALMAGFQTSYKIVSAEPHMSRCLPSDAPIVSSSASSSTSNTQRLLEIHNRSTGQHLLGPVDLATEEGRQALASFLSAQSGQDVTCVSAGSESNNSKSNSYTAVAAPQTPTHTHQFGNTGSGVKVRGDTRTLHIVNLNTIRALSEKIGVELNPYRFRPNIVIDGPPAWSEFAWVGKNLVVMDKSDTSDGSGKPTGMRLAVIQKTVRCEATHVDPTDPADPYPEIVKLLVKHFPEHGPFLGVYAVVDEPGSLALGQEFKVVD
jgi:uncharacterized protein YcbX